MAMGRRGRAGGVRDAVDVLLQCRLRASRALAAVDKLGAKSSASAARGTLLTARSAELTHPSPYSFAGLGRLLLVSVHLGLLLAARRQSVLLLLIIKRLAAVLNVVWSSAPPSRNRVCGPLRRPSASPSPHLDWGLLHLHLAPADLHAEPTRPAAVGSLGSTTR